ncbi:hypothetical protein EDD66_101199 [Mobilisporobacter senegalensis]|uniref:Uncharacterized protein n=1 Tax=Mobilisporobacter senegalensis TaxID=1329262 RepID=A0A3N1Y229_9FIRM|nr:hypothetical protein [Mobilisporobacter senegalensis]ROR31582.1 hypothetical protein EDD66_101199 [Mobilisporobacter senegalensis]
MILLKANPEIKAVFQKMINTMGEKVVWTEVFLINNNDIILAGEKKSLFFNFDNKRIFSKFVELNINEERVDKIVANSLLENTLNMILYAFGKWGEIKGLKVETEYDQLNRLLNNILIEINIEASLTDENFRFFKNGILITYEEVIQSILDKSKLEEKDNKEETQENEEDGNNPEEEPKEEGYALGLWHNIQWISGQFSFGKVELTEGERGKLRLGNNFYVVNYKCPDCGEKLYMVVYPVGKEFRIETDELPVYMARAYTCNTCNHFYTPKPHKLLMEGDVYHLIFEDDKVAYEDYLELLGRWGERTANSNFNLYESEYNKKQEEEPEELEKISNELESMTEEKLAELQDKMDSGFYPLLSVERYHNKIDKERKKRKQNRRKARENAGMKEGLKRKEVKEKAQDFKRINSKDIKRPRLKTSSPSIQPAKTLMKGYTTPPIKKGVKPYLERIKEEKSVNDNTKPRNTTSSSGRQSIDQKMGKGHEKSINHSAADSISRSSDSLKENFLKEILEDIIEGMHDIFEIKLDKLSLKQLTDLKALVQSEQRLDNSKKYGYINKIEKKQTKEKIKELNQKIGLSQDKSYIEILRTIDDVKKEDWEESVKKPFLESLMEYLIRSGEKELKNLVLNIPENLNKKQYIQFTDKMEQYKEIDTNRYKKILDEKRDGAEKQEIIAFIKRANATNRTSLFDLFHKIKEQDFSEKNLSPYLEEIHDKIYALDEAAIKKICPDPAEINFEEGLRMYEEISSGDFLPELKVNTLGLIDQRLKKIKMDECEQLVKKLSKDMKWTREDFPRIYFFDVRKMMRGNGNDESSITVHNALNTYAVNRGKYEYPILICDTSSSGNGKVGFVLTPDHIFYSSLISADVMNVMNVKEVFGYNGLLGKGIYVEHKHSGRIRISKSIKSVKLKSFGKILNEFIEYLKEKPESRSISYLAKEKHTVKCCYRCGYVYKGGSVCPKCGSKNNK